jgi:hypothetical protein
VPRDAIGTNGKRSYVKVQRGSSYEERDVTVATMSALDAVVTSGVDPGMVVARNVSPATSETTASSEPVPAATQAATQPSKQ